MSRKIDVICFSGTGNTAYVVDVIIQVLEENGFETCEKSNLAPYVPEVNTSLLLAFPANSQSVSPYIWKYFRSLADGNGTKVYVVFTMNESAFILTPLKNLLLRKGYVPQGAVEISMPNNMTNANDQTINRMESAVTQAKNFALGITGNSVDWEERCRGSAFVSFLTRKTVLPWVSVRFLLKLETDANKCTRCGACVRECPVQNIRMTGLPIHGNRCEFCMHCSAVCNSGAIHVEGKPNIHLRHTEKYKV
jgi:ferredoxin/flavodoxin